LKLHHALLLGSALAMGLAPMAQAQQSSKPAAQGIVDPDSVVGWSARAIAMIDRGELAPLWDGASAATKGRVRRDDFVAGVQASRKALGAASAREWTSVRRQLNTGTAGLPAGEYVTVELVSQFAQKQVKAEMVTFRHDEDGLWRFAGYAVR